MAEKLRDLSQPIDVALFDEAEKLRDLSQPIDAALLDATVATFYGTGLKEERTAAHRILWELQNNPDTWLQTVHILENAQNLNTKLLTLQLLEDGIKYKWNTFLAEQRDRIYNYISEAIFQLSSDEASFRRERLYANKLNIILVQILKQEWPARWKSFITDLVLAARASEMICENCMAILKLFIEEVFDFSREMNQQNIEELKESLNSEFKRILELCLFELLTSRRKELLRATLATLNAFLSWIRLGCIFDMPLVETLLKFFPVTSYGNLTLQCLTKVAALQFGDFHDKNYVMMYTVFMAQLQTILPPGTNIPEVYANGSSEKQAFIQNLALFFTTFYKSHIRLLEAAPDNRATLLLGLEYLIGISNVDNSVVFKVCLDYWNSLIHELFEAHCKLDTPAGTPMMGFQSPLIPGMVDSLGSPLLERRQLYSGPISKLRLLLIHQMANSEEVSIMEDENGNIVRETMKDNQYKIMKETLTYLVHLDHEDTEQQVYPRVTARASRMTNSPSSRTLLRPRSVHRTVVRLGRQDASRGVALEMRRQLKFHSSFLESVPRGGDIEQASFAQSTTQVFLKSSFLTIGTGCIRLSMLVSGVVLANNFHEMPSRLRDVAKWLTGICVVVGVLGVTLVALGLQGRQG